MLLENLELLLIVGVGHFTQIVSISEEDEKI